MSEGEYKNSWIWRDGISEGEETHEGEHTVAEEYKWFLLDGLKTRTEMETSTAKKLQTSLFLTLLFSLACDTQTVPDCCRQKTCSCRIYDLLHGTGNHAAGILTLGKRKTDGQAYQSRLYRLLHASGNHAAGILTMGKRGEAGSIQSPDNSMVNQMCPSPSSVLDHYSSSDSM